MKKNFSINSINKFFYNLSKNDCIDQLIANESLNIVKGHPQYLNIFKLKTFFEYFIIFIKYVLLLINKIIFSFFFFNSKLYKKKIKSELLIVSHLIKFPLNINNLNKDLYFSEFEKNKAFKKKKKFKIFINHTSYFKQGFRDEKKIILQNYTSFISSIIIFNKLFLQFLKFFISSFFIKKGSSANLRIIALEFLSPKTFNNLIFKNNLKLLIKEAEINKVFFTFEGFGWERFLCEIIKKNNNNTKIIAYQFAALLKQQNSMFQKIHSKYLPHVILTVGKINYKILKKKFSKVIILGSSRRFPIKRKFSNYKNKKNLNCLVLPEGIDTECINLINFTIKCAKENPRIKFIIRFHPLTNTKKLLFSIKFLDSIKDLKNVVISKKSLLSDIKNSSICFYRGSTSVITAVQCGVFPFYIDFENKLNIDPMYKINHLIFYLRTFKDFNLKINESVRLNIMKKIRKFAQDYFLEFNQHRLTKIINSR
jgi:hypothetical protein